MSPENAQLSLESDNIKETELTLGIPGESRVMAKSTEAKSGAKRLFSETVNLNLGTSSDDNQFNDADHGVEDEGSCSGTKSPAAKAQVVGWPPVRTSRKNLTKKCKYVKVAVDGAPYLRKVDLEMYNSYQQLLNAIEDIYPCLTIRNYLNERKAMDPANANGAEYVPAYEDKDGDWMLVGDVPWKMFVESCKRLWLMKSSEAPVKCGSSS